MLGKLGAGDGGHNTDVTFKGAGLDAAVTTPYPGVALAFLGAALMGLSILVPFSFETRDGPIYLAPAVQVKLAGSGGAGVAIDPWPEPDEDGSDGEPDSNQADVSNSSSSTEEQNPTRLGK